MKQPMKYLITAGAALIVLVLGGGAFIWSGLYNVGADDTHTKPVHALLQTLRERSIQVRAERLQPPDLADDERIRQGAGNYDAMCVGCHLSPGMAATELSEGLYPAPPNLSTIPVVAAEAFWVIKHGIKASGMPAWGKSMHDDYIWNMVAFMQTLPRLDAAQYRTLVASSDGHSHGGGEPPGHAHADEAAGHHHPASAPDNHSGKPMAEPHMASYPQDVHQHADGSTHVHESVQPKAEKNENVKRRH